MARHHDDEQYSEALMLAFRRVFDRLVAEGVDADFAELLADDEAREEVEAQLAEAREYADDERIARWIDVHEFA